MFWFSTYEIFVHQWSGWKHRCVSGTEEESRTSTRIPPTSPWILYGGFFQLIENLESLQLIQQRDAWRQEEREGEKGGEVCAKGDGFLREGNFLQCICGLFLLRKC